MEALKMMNLKKELIIEVSYDDCAESPREWDNLGTFYTWDRNYFSPDKNDFSNGVEFVESILGSDVTEKIHSKYNNSKDFMNEVQIRMDKLGYIIFPVSKYEHGLVNYSLGSASGWDTGTVGVIFAEKKKIYEWLQVKRITAKVFDDVERIFSNELEVYTNYANGEVYYYTLTDLQENMIDSIGGFHDDMTDEATVYDRVWENSGDIGERKDWEIYDECKFYETFEVVTTIKRK